jgi:hypothetical protein
MRWGLCAFSLPALEGATQVKNGKAHGPELQGKGSRSILLTYHSIPHGTLQSQAVDHVLLGRAHRIQ